MAIDLTTNWSLVSEQQLYRSDVKLRTYAKVKSQSIENNSTVVQTWMGIYISDTWSYSTTTCTGHVSGASDFSYSNKSFSTGETYLSGGEFTVAHNSDGTARTYITWWLSQTYGGNISYTESTWLNLPTIPRTSYVSVSNSNMTAGQTYTINTNRKSDSFTHTISCKFGSLDWTIASGVGASVNWTPQTSMLAQIPNAKSGTGTITCITYNGSTQIGTSTCSFTLNIPSGSNPTLSSQIVTETNNYVKAKGDSITLQQISSKSVSVKASAKHSASVSKVTCNGVSLTNNGGTWSGTLSNLSTGTFTFIVTDSRGLAASVSVNTTYYEYAKPQLTEGSLTREEQTSSNGTLNVKGNFKDILSNTVTMTYERKVDGNSEGQMSVTPTVSSGNVSYTQDYTDLYYTKSYDVTITITDSFGEVATATIHLGTGAYALWLGKTGIKVSGDGTFGGTVTPSALKLTGATISIDGVSFKITIS